MPASVTSLLAALVAVPFVPAAASAQFFVPPDSSQIGTTASAERLVAPDRAILFLEVRGGGASGDLATLELGDTRARLETALAAAGIEGSAVTAWGLAAGEAVPMRGPPGPAGAEPDAWEARAGLRVVTTPARVEVVAQAATAAGAAVLTSVYEAVDTEAVKAEVLQEAVAAARGHAQAVATALGRSLGRLVQVSTMPDYLEAASRGQLLQVGYPGQGVRLTPNHLVVRVTVQTAWQLLER